MWRSAKRLLLSVLMLLTPLVYFEWSALAQPRGRTCIVVPAYPGTEVDNLARAFAERLARTGRAVTTVSSGYQPQEIHAHLMSAQGQGCVPMLLVSSRFAIDRMADVRRLNPVGMVGRGPQDSGIWYAVMAYGDLSRGELQELNMAIRDAATPDWLERFGLQPMPARLEEVQRSIIQAGGRKICGSTCPAQCNSCTRDGEDYCCVSGRYPEFRSGQ